MVIPHKNQYGLELNSILSTENGEEPFLIRDNGCENIEDVTKISKYDESKKPDNIEEYKHWMKNKFNIEISEREKAYYESVTNKIKSDFEKSAFWIHLTENLKKYGEEYLVSTGYNLFTGEMTAPDYIPELIIKPYESFLLKTFRHNVIDNNKWPDQPPEGWILPENWLNKINDLVRTLFVVKYLDGVQFIADKIKNHDNNCVVEYKAKDEGYYAAHVYTKQIFEIPKVNWDTKKEDILIEIQITTQLQEVIRKLLHTYYESNRKKIKRESTKWQWDYKCDEFSTNYLGHILHYIEGMIIEIRDKQDQCR